MYLLDVIQTDSNLNIRRHVARLLSEGLLVSLSLGEVATVNSQPSIIDTDLTGTIPEAERVEAAGKAIIKGVRKDFGKKTEMKETIFNLLTYVINKDYANCRSNAATPDPITRMALIRAAENMSVSQPEPLPRNTVILHTPQIEVAPALPTPRIKISMGGTPGVKPEQDSECN